MKKNNQEHVLSMRPLTILSFTFISISLCQKKRVWMFFEQDYDVCQKPILLMKLSLTLKMKG